MATLPLRSYSAGVKATVTAAARERRLRNREYMRRWRADPLHRQSERIHSTNWRRGRNLQDPHHPGPTVCGFCHRRRSRSVVPRLRPVETGFVEVQMPYCGLC